MHRAFLICMDIGLSVRVVRAGFREMVNGIIKKVISTDLFLRILTNVHEFPK